MKETWTLTIFEFIKIMKCYLKTAILLFINIFSFALQAFFPEVETKNIFKKIKINIETKTAGSWVCHILEITMIVYKLSLNNTYKNPILLEHWWFSPVPSTSRHLQRKVFN